MRLAVVVASLLIGMMIGGWLMLTAQDATPRPASDTRARSAPTEASSTTSPATSPPSTTPTSPPTSPPPPSDQVLLVWTPGRLPDRFADQVGELAGVSVVTTVRSGLVHVEKWSDSTGEAAHRAPDGFVVPFEVMGFDPTTYPALLGGRDAGELRQLGADEVVLGSTSARLHGLDRGGKLMLEDGSSLDVATVVDDVVIGAAEAAVRVDTATRLGVDTERYLLIRHSGSRKDLEDAVHDLLPEGLGVRIRAPGETPVLRHGDAVLPQVMIKQRFGEFSYRLDGGQTFDVDPAWREDSIVAAEVPLLGSVSCHRNLLPALIGAMEELEKRNLGSLIQQVNGCFNPRFIAGGKGISRHAWGAAVDINIGTNPEGLESIQDPRLIDVMERWGFTSGHEWLIPDPGHFEYVRPPTP